VKGFKDSGFETKVQSLKDFEEDYGFKAPEGEEDDDDDDEDFDDDEGEGDDETEDGTHDGSEL
jgi:hypothetical protein